MEDLFRTLPKLLKQFDDSEEVREAVIFAAWRKIAGKSLCEHTAPLQLVEKQLAIAVADETWKLHLESLASQMIFKLNSILGNASVTFIKFRIDEETISNERNRGNVNNLSDSQLEEIALDEVTPKLRISADSIEDKNLRCQFLLAAGSCLARKKRMK